MKEEEKNAQATIAHFCSLVHYQKKYITEMTKLCREQLLNVSLQIQNSQKNCIISHKLYIETIQTLQNCDKSLCKIAQKSVRSGLRDITKVRQLLWGVTCLCGCSNIEIFIRFLERELRGSSDEKEFYSRFFKIISLSLSKKRSKKTKSSDQVLNYPMTHLKDIKLNTNLLIGVHGAEVHFKISKTETLVCLGYFSPSILNIPSIYFPAKILSLRTHLVDLNDIPPSFADSFIQQLSLGYFCTHSVPEILKECSKKFKQIQSIKNMTISSLVKQFLTSSTIEKRETIILLLLNDDDSDTEHLAYLLYDMISNKAYVMAANTCADDIFNSLHWTVQNKLKQQLVVTTKKLSEISEDVTDVFSYEKQILMMKTNNRIKSKAMSKLKEIKNGKGADVTKATQYLDGLLKVPFGIYKYEPITSELALFKSEFKILISEMPSLEKENDALQVVSNGEHLTYYTIEDFVHTKYQELCNLAQDAQDEYLSSQSLMQLKKWAKQFSIKTTRMRKAEVLLALSPHVQEIIENHCPDAKCLKFKTWLNKVSNFGVKWCEYGNKKQKYIENVGKILDSSVYGLTEAKEQIKRIIGQWINGKDRGYVFGFEGPPGTGKTTLAKEGIAHCLQDENGGKRPFAFIALGGSTNGSTLEGHNYTYVGSTWGKIVDAIMTAKCMNPIIYIDELDKISNTEHGREIVGILIHLTDPSQNEEFSDRYFSGIHIDLSKCLIIFSYNDPSKVDRILLDRIHRIKTKPLDKYEKKVIIQEYVLPEMIKTIGFNESDIVLSEDVVHYLITAYTFEAGVRKVKEKLYHILRHINLHILLKSESFEKRPVEITKELIDEILQNETKHRVKSIPQQNRVGVANGLYATASGVGGLTMIQMFPMYSEKNFALKITGQQGDVMKESISVAQTVAWHLLTFDVQQQLEARENWGIHLHCPETSTPKDGPSAGGVLTVAFLSIFTDEPVNRECAMTGEIDLLGNIMQIGGLVSKLEGARVAGAKRVLIPRNNEEDYEKIKRNTPQFKEDDDFRVIIVDTIYDVLHYMFPNKAGLLQKMKPLPELQQGSSLNLKESSK